MCGRVGKRISVFRIRFRHVFLRLFMMMTDFVATDKSIENSDIFLPVIKHQFFYIADY